MELTEFGFTGVNLMDGERVAFAIDSANHGGNRSSNHPEALLLTDSRVIHLRGKERQRRAVMAAVSDVEAVEITAHRRGYGAYLWAALALALSVMLFGTIENTGVKVASSVIVLLMGVYLIANHLTEPGRPAVVFRAGGSEIRWEFEDGERTDVDAFVNRLYLIKASAGNRLGVPSRFAPR